MSYLIYLTLKGSNEELLSAGCSTEKSIGNRCQSGHEDQIQVLRLNHTITRHDNISHHPLWFVKPIDKLSPILGQLLDENKKLTANFEFYRTNTTGQLELFYTVLLKDACLVSVSSLFPHAVNSVNATPEEEVMLKYQSITWSHKTANSSGYSFWSDGGQ